MTDPQLSNSAKAQVTGEKKLQGLVPFVRNVFFAAGVGLVLLSGGLIVTYVAELITGETKHSVGSQLGLITFLAGIVFVGCKLIQSRLTEHKAVKELREEQAILNRARAKSAALSISETALECRLSISDTKKTFERLSRSGVCHIDVSEEGELCYRFPSFEKDCNGSKSFLLDPQFELKPERQEQ